MIASLDVVGTGLLPPVAGRVSLNGASVIPATVSIDARLPSPTAGFDCSPVAKLP